uniref:DNA repair protein RAD50 n=1 Tax=Lygus hesperus TaxID=30085 RepID=A0A0A9VPL5_LYGHE
MSYFEKLSIQGIRCFGPDESDMGIIKFGLPLTLILGNNGCGKTTIIESLNFATCGEFPPGCSGPCKTNFVHDPKIMARPEVKGQIRLLVKDVRGQSVSVSRTVQVSQRTVKAQFKSVDQVVSRYDATKDCWKSITGRCTDADTEMCLALGVSKSVLSNVLLCHQEDSNWPLDEDSKVKAKFDEIFGSDKYNKCLDELKKSQNKLTDDSKKLKHDLTVNLEQNRKDARDMRSRLEESQERFERYQNQVEEFASRLNPIQKRLKELAVKEDEISLLRTSLETQKAKLEAVRSTMRDLKNTIQHEFKGSKAELEDAITNFALELKEKKNSLERLETRAEDVRIKLARNQEALSTEQIRLGQLNGELEANNRNIDARGQAMMSLSEELGLNTSLSQLSQSDEIQKIFFELERAKDSKVAEIELVKVEHSEAVAALQRETFNLRENRAQIDSSLRNKKDQMNQNKEELRKVKESIFEADQSAELLGKLQLQLEQVKSKFEELKKSEDVDALNREISSSKQENERMEDELVELEKQVGDLQLMSEVQAQLDVRKNEKSAKDLEVRKLKSRHEDTLKELLQLTELPDQGLKFQLDARMEQFADTIKSKTEQLRKIEKQIATKEADNNHISTKLKEAKQQLEADDFAVKQACNGQDYDMYTVELSKRLSDLQDEKGTLSSSEHFYRRYVQKLKKDEPCCPLCKRDFAAEEEVNKLISELSLKMREVPSKLRQNKEQLDQVQEKYEKLLQLKSKHDKVGTLKNAEIPALENNLARSNSELATLKATRSTIQDELEAPQALESMAKSIQSDIIQLERSLSDSRKLGKEVATIEEKLKLGSGTKKTLQEALDDKQRKRALVQQNRRKVEALEGRLRNFETRRVQLQDEKHSIQDQQFKISGNAQRRAQLSERKAELEGIESLIQVELDQLAQELVTVTRQIDQSEKKVESAQQSNAAEAERLNRQMRDIERRWENINEMNGKIVNYELSGGMKKLEMCKGVIEKLHRVGDEISQELRTLGDRCDKIKADIASQTTRERDLQDNLKLRNKMVEERSFASSVEEMNQKIGDLNYASIFEERKGLKEQEAKLYSEKKEAEGSLVELKKSIRVTQGDLEKPHLKNAERKYRDTAAHIEVIEQAKTDLDNFYKALDWAMMSYHQKKIKHINNVINELWRKVYSGNDIDAIKIVAEQESTACASKRRAFKYRVVQTKCGSDIDMRNRCSAGQKVLACLIIRIALAETFSSHCGVLALDEPTTNLDQENIINLSKTLVRLVHMQANRKNFQLMVITHDQEFLKELTRLEGIDHYYKLDRTGDGKSKVTKVNV